MALSRLWILGLVQTFVSLAISIMKDPMAHVRRLLDLGLEALRKIVPKISYENKRRYALLARGNTDRNSANRRESKNYIKESSNISHISSLPG